MKNAPKNQENLWEKLDKYMVDMISSSVTCAYVIVAIYVSLLGSCMPLISYWTFKKEKKLFGRLIYIL